MLSRFDLEPEVDFQAFEKEFMRFYDQAKTLRLVEKTGKIGKRNFFGFAMNRKVIILKKAENDLKWFRQHNRPCYVKCFDLIRETMQDPRYGTGKPERLKYFDREVWSRRVSHEHRLIYVIYSNEELVEIVSCKSHYHSNI